MNKEDGAFLTITELAQQLHLPQHVLRYWETRFSQLRPLTRAGNRRYYRPDDVALVTQINQLLNVEKYSISGAQKVLANTMPRTDMARNVSPSHGEGINWRQALGHIRDTLANALAA